MKTNVDVCSVLSVTEADECYKQNSGKQIWIAPIA